MHHQFIPVRTFDVVELLVVDSKLAFGKAQVFVILFLSFEELLEAVMLFFRVSIWHVGHFAFFTYFFEIEAFRKVFL